MSKKLLLLALVFAFGWSTAAQAGEREPKKNRSGSTQPTANAGVAACELGTSSIDLEVNNVRARLYNTGGLFWRGGDPVYEVPKGSGIQAIFASGIWVGGEVGGELRFAGADYSDWEFWPGPLDDAGNAPADCSPFDRFWNVTVAGSETVTLTVQNEDGEDETITRDLPIYEGDVDSWPVDLGAPYFDINGDGTYSPADGDRPAVVSNELGQVTTNVLRAAFPDQQIWWVMNDKGNAHNWSGAEPIGLEVRAHAFAFATADAIGNTTFYKYQMIYKGDAPLEDTYIGLWSDPDLGDFNDDFVGSDPDLGLGFVYNGDPFDNNAYLNLPPALGYDFFQGPLVDDDGVDNNGNGETDEEGERIAMEKFVYYNNDTSQQGNPDGGPDAYNYLRGIWRDGTPITAFGNGYNPGSNFEETDFIWPDDPPSFWSEYNTDGAGTANVPADRRFLMSAGPFTMTPVDGELVEGENLQNVVFGIQWSRSSSTEAPQPQIASQRLLEFENAIVQGAFNSNFNVPRPPAPPIVKATALDGQVILTWENPETSNNFLSAYEVTSPFADPAEPDVTYNFEGYRILQYDFLGDQNPEEIAVLDEVNGVGAIVDQTISPTFGEVITDVVVGGGDNGVRNFYVVENVTNSREYIFAVQAYAYNAFSSPQRVYASPIQLGVNQVRVVPSNVAPTNGGTVLNASSGQVVDFQNRIGPNNQGVFQATIADPASVTGSTYRADFFLGETLDLTTEEETDSTTTLLYTVSRTDEDGSEVVFDARDYIGLTGRSPFAENVFQDNGIVFTITDAPAAVAGGGSGIVEVAAPIDPCGADAGSTGGCDVYGGNSVWHSLNSTSEYYVSASGSGEIDRLERFAAAAAPEEFEMRITGEENWGVDAFTTGNVVKVPFELWNLGTTPDDPSDDVQMIPFVLSNSDDDSPIVDWFEAANVYPGEDATFGFPASDVIYFLQPDRPNGYELFAEVAAETGAGNAYPFGADGDDLDDGSPAGGACGNNGLGIYIDFCYRADDLVTPSEFIYPIGRFTLNDFGLSGAPPQVGTVIRIVTTKPITDGFAAELTTADLAVETGVAEVERDALDLIQIVPNPYRGFSGYERGNVDKIARFTNLPEEATIRIFTLAGTLVRTFEKVPGTGTILNWDLNNESGLPVASGIYLIHVDVPGVGERVLKFGLVQRRLQLDTF